MTHSTLHALWPECARLFGAGDSSDPTPHDRPAWLDPSLPPDVRWVAAVWSNRADLSVNQTVVALGIADQSEGRASFPIDRNRLGEFTGLAHNPVTRGRCRLVELGWLALIPHSPYQRPLYMLRIPRGMADEGS